MAFPEPGVCVLCGIDGASTPEGKLTSEHAFPNWIVEELRPHVMGQGEFYLDGRLQPQYAGMEVEIEAVCRSCNTDWLSNTFERKVAKWLRPSLLHLEPHVILDQHQRALLGAWAVKTALMVELALAELRVPALVPKRHFDWLYDHREPPRDVEPPPGCTVWMFGVNITSGAIGIVKTLLTWTTAATILVPGETGEVPKGYFATFSVGHVGFQVLGWDLDEADLVNPGWPLRPRMPEAVREGVRQVWPAPRKPPLRWPFMSDEGGVLLTARDQTSMELLARWPWVPNLATRRREFPAQQVWERPGRHDDAP